MANSVGLHEDADRLAPETIDRHRALASLQEELEAIDWYAQRADACADAELRGILTHNMNEEKEHAAMVLEWLRRRDPKLDEHLRTYLFRSEPILALEKAAEQADAGAASTPESGAGDLGLRGLRAQR